MPSVLVIGGTSLIGRPLVEQLLERGDEVTILHRGAATPFGSRVREVRADRNDAAEVRQAVSGRRFDLVFDNVYDWQRGTTADQVLDTAQAVSAGGRPDRYVFMSSIAVYPLGGPRREDDDLVGADDPNPYCANKAASERALRRLEAETGLAVTTLRPAFVYGPGNPFEREAWFWDRLLASRPIILPGDGTRTMQWIHGREVARAAVLTASDILGAGRAFNLGSEPITQADWVRLLARVAGVEANLVPIDRARLEDAGGQLLAPPLYFGQYLDIPPITVTTERMGQIPGFALQSLEEGFRETFEWYRAQERLRPDWSWEDAVLAGVA